MPGRENCKIWAPPPRLPRIRCGLSKYKSTTSNLGHLVLSWNPRLKAKWAREKEDGQVKIVQTHGTKEELRHRVFDFMSEHSPSTSREISTALRLDVMENIRLPVVLDELEAEGLAVKQIKDNERVYSIIHTAETSV
jgi:hypothetical protein